MTRGGAIFSPRRGHSLARSSSRPLQVRAVEMPSAPAYEPVGVVTGVTMPAAPVLAQSVQAQGWTSGIFDCCMDQHTLGVAWCCPWLSFARTHSRAGLGSFCKLFTVYLMLSLAGILMYGGGRYELARAEIDNRAQFDNGGNLAAGFHSKPGFRGGSHLKGMAGPAWTRGEMEPPAGEKDMGGWTAAVYTEEQQARLGVDESGNKPGGFHGHHGFHGFHGHHDDDDDDDHHHHDGHEHGHGHPDHECMHECMSGAYETSQGTTVAKHTMMSAAGCKRPSPGHPPSEACRDLARKMCPQCFSPAPEPAVDPIDPAFLDEEDEEPAEEEPPSCDASTEEASCTAKPNCRWCPKKSLCHPVDPRMEQLRALFHSKRFRCGMAMLGASMLLGLALTCLRCCYRRRLRSQMGVQGTAMGDCCAHTLVPCCALAQEARHVNACALASVASGAPIGPPGLQMLPVILGTVQPQEAATEESGSPIQGVVAVKLV